MIGDYAYLSYKAIMMELFKAIWYTQCFSFNIAVSLFCPDEALPGEYNGPKDATV